MNLRQRLGREIVADHEIERRSGDQADGLEFARIVLDAAVDRRRGGMAAEAADGERIAVGLGVGAARAADGAAGAADVLDDHPLTERAAHVVGGDARQHVGRAAGREHDDHGDRLRREGLLGERGRRRQQQAHQSEYDALHFIPRLARPIDCEARLAGETGRRLSKTQPRRMSGRMRPARQAPEDFQLSGRSAAMRSAKSVSLRSMNSAPISQPSRHATRHSRRSRMSFEK